MIKEIVKVGNPILRQEAKPVAKVDKRIQQLITDLSDTLIVQKKPEGIGLAAPQIGIPLQVFVARIGKHIVPFINPVIISKNGETIDLIEGCLSISKYWGNVKRWSQITVKTLNKEGKTVVRTYKNLYARIVQHEVDHLRGNLFVDRVSEQKGKFYELKDDMLYETRLQ